MITHIENSTERDMLYTKVKAVTKPEVSIITPMFNALKYIKATAESVLTQTYTDFEWIIIDDYSNDGSFQYICELAENDPRIKPIKMPRNGGPIKARNAGMDAAVGRYIAFIDADDLWLPEKLEKQIAFMKFKNVALSYTGYKKINDDGSIKSGVQIPIPERAGYHRIMQSDSIMASSAIFDIEKTGEVRQSLDAPIGRDDLHFFLGILKSTGPAGGIPEELARLRIHGDSITGNKVQSAKRQWDFYRKTMKQNIVVAVTNFVIYAIKGFSKYLF